MKYYQWQRMQQKRYVIDKDYLKIQGLAFLVFTVIAGFCFAIIHSAEYYSERRQHERFLATSNALKHVDTLFNKGQYDEAFKTIYELKKEDPLEYRYNYARDSLVQSLRAMADKNFNTQNFSDAVGYYLILKKHENPESFETIRQISLCQFYLGNYQEALHAMKQLHNLRPYSMELVYRIGMLNLEKLENPEEALYYFSYGKKIFKENLTEIYGAAFEVVMNPVDAPDIYFDLFEARARANIQLKNYEEAVTDCNWAVFLRRERSNPYILRATANAGLQNFEDLCTDLRKAKKLGGTGTETMARRYCQ
jgi:tetratricopeptide (TPR) repeat protein